MPLIPFYDLQYEAIRLNPKDADAWYGKGLALKNQEKYDEAIKGYDEAIRLDHFYRNLAIIMPTPPDRTPAATALPGTPPLAGSPPPRRAGRGTPPPVSPRWFAAR